MSCGPGDGSPSTADSGKGDNSKGAPPATGFEGRSFEDVRNEAFRMQDAREDPQLILAALKAAHALNPDAYGVNRRLGEVYGELKLHVEALTHYQRARVNKPEAVEDGLAVVRLLLALDRHEEALEELAPLLTDESTRGEALFHQARILDFLGDRAAALDILQSATTADPALAYHAISLNGRFLMEDGDFSTAEILFRQALAGRADYKEALRGMADVCRRLQRPEEAQHWDRILTLFLDLTDNVFARKQRAARRRTLTALVTEYPAWTPGYRQLALHLRRDGDGAAACEVIRDFLETHSELVEPEEASALRDAFCSGVDS